MKVAYSKSFIKAASKVSGKLKQSLQQAIIETKNAQSVNDITDCKKLTGFSNVYRIRVGNHRAFFTIRVINNTIFFEYFLPRGQAYSKQVMESLHSKE